MQLRRDRVRLLRDILARLCGISCQPPLVRARDCSQRLPVRGCAGQDERPAARGQLWRRTRYWVSSQSVSSGAEPSGVYVDLRWAEVIHHGERSARVRAAFRQGQSILGILAEMTSNTSESSGHLTRLICRLGRVRIAG